MKNYFTILINKKKENTYSCRYYLFCMSSFLSKKNVFALKHKVHVENSDTLNPYSLDIQLLANKINISKNLIFSKTLQLHEYYFKFVNYLVITVRY